MLRVRVWVPGLRFRIQSLGSVTSVAVSFTAYTATSLGRRQRTLPDLQNGASEPNAFRLRV